MSNLLRLADYRQQIEQQQVEVRKVSLDDGYTQIANELLLAIAKFGFTQRQRAVLDAVILKTYRFHKKTDWISNSQICELTGISHECKISTAKQELIRMNVLVQKGREIGINPVITEWVKEDLPKKENIYQNGKKTFIETVKEDLPKKETQKKLLQTIINIPPLPPKGRICLSANPSQNALLKKLIIRLSLTHGIKRMKIHVLACRLLRKSTTGGSVRLKNSLGNSKNRQCLAPGIISEHFSIPPHLTTLAKTIVVGKQVLILLFVLTLCCEFARERCDD